MAELKALWCIFVLNTRYFESSNWYQILTCFCDFIIFFKYSKMYIIFIHVSTWLIDLNNQKHFKILWRKFRNINITINNKPMLCLSLLLVCYVITPLFFTVTRLLILRFVLILCTLIESWSILRIINVLKLTQRTSNSVYIFLMHLQTCNLVKIIGQNNISSRHIVFFKSEPSGWNKR